MAREIVYDEITAFSVTAHIEGLDETYEQNDRHIRWSIYDEDRDPIELKPFKDLKGGIYKSPTVTFENLEIKTKYIIYYYIYPDSYAWDTNGEDTFRTLGFDPDIWKINTDYGKEDVRIYWDCEGHVSGVTYKILAREKGSGNEWVEKASLSKPPKNYTSIEVNKYKVTYEVKVTAFYDGEEYGNDTDDFSVPPLSPGPWEWTTAEWKALTENGETKTITVERWNRFISWLNDVIGYRAAEEDQDYAQIPNSAKAGSDKILYANSWNAIDYYSSLITGHTHIEVYPRMSCLWKLYYKFNRSYEYIGLKGDKRKWC